ncbi:MAG: hypothetical protein IPM45_07625 [Acidimicrobiales bacterium]|nr:hypothetical protein [Acidimicrobiales bacterium]
MSAVAAFVLPAWLMATLSVVGGYRGNYVPGVDAPERDFVRFYVDNFSRIPVTSTMFILAWVLVLVVLVGVVRAASARLDLVGVLAVTLVGASTAVSVATQGLFTYPTLVLEMTAGNMSENLDPGVARFLVLSTEAAQSAAGILTSVALLLIALLLARSDLWGHWVLAVTAAVMGVVGTMNMIIGGGGVGNGTIGIIPWGLLSGVILLIARSRLRAGTEA